MKNSPPFSHSKSLKLPTDSLISKELFPTETISKAGVCVHMLNVFPLKALDYCCSFGIEALQALSTKKRRQTKEEA
jgi:hypothetical protein